MPATEPLYRRDAYLRECTATVLSVDDRGGIVLDRTVFYPAAGGQPGDRGTIGAAGGALFPIASTAYDSERAGIVHYSPEGLLPLPAGTPVHVQLDWETRYRHMRMHTALHLLASLVRYPVTGGQISAQEGRLDFDIADADAVDKDRLAGALNDLVAADHPVGERWITEAELDASPQLVRTLRVQPPRGAGSIRLVAIGEGGTIDLQPCGGTHVRATGEIGALAVTRIEKKGRQNRRIRIAFA